MFRAVLFLALLALTPGCIATTHMSPNPTNKKYLEVQWRPDYETAEADAVRENKPILAIVAAGAMKGFC